MARPRAKKMGAVKLRRGTDPLLQATCFPLRRKCCHRAHRAFVTWRANVHFGLVNCSLGRHPSADCPPSTVARLRNHRLRRRGGDIGDTPEGVVPPDARAGREYACFQAGTRTGWPVDSYLQPNAMGISFRLIEDASFEILSEMLHPTGFESDGVFPRNLC